MPEDTRQRALHRAVGQALAEARRQLGLTQDELSLRTDRRISRSVVANLESGRQRLTLDQLYDLAEALRVDPIDLLPKASSLPSRSATRQAALRHDPAAERFVSNLRRTRRSVLDATKESER